MQKRKQMLQSNKQCSQSSRELETTIIERSQLMSILMSIRSIQSIRSIRRTKKELVKDEWSSILDQKSWLVLSCHLRCGHSWQWSPPKVVFAGSKKTNIARGTTDPEYWVYNLNYLFDWIRFVFISAAEIIQVIDLILWVRCASGNVFSTLSKLLFNIF